MSTMVMRLSPPTQSQNLTFRRLRAFGAIVGLFLAGCSAGSSQRLVPIVRMVQVGASGCGSDEVAAGFVVRPGVVMTVAHVLADTSIVTVDGRPATVVSVDERMDAALLETDVGGERSVVFADPVLSDTAVILRWQARQLQRIDVTVTTVAPIDYSDLRLGTRWLRQGLLVDHESRAGDSGAPVLDQAGRVIGMLFASRTEGKPEGFALAASEMQALMSADPVVPGWVGRCS